MDINPNEYYRPGASGSYAHLFTAEAQAERDEELREKFASGQGVVELQPNMPDIVLLSVMQFAIGASNGKPFLVVPPSK